MLCERHCQENEKTNDRLGKNTCKRHNLIKDLSKIYKEPLKFNNKKINNPIKKWSKTLTDTSSKKMLHIICHQGNVN